MHAWLTWIFLNASLCAGDLERFPALTKCNFYTGQSYSLLFRLHLCSLSPALFFASDVLLTARHPLDQSTIITPRGM
jgi:hypothetical protein